jgi:hypothetical protein
VTAWFHSWYIYLLQNTTRNSSSSCTWGCLSLWQCLVLIFFEYQHKKILLQEPTVTQCHYPNLLKSSQATWPMKGIARCVWGSMPPGMT